MGAPIEFEIQDGKPVGGWESFWVTVWRATRELRNGRWLLSFRDGRKRSLSQNALYWAWLGRVEDYTGYSSTALHEMLMQAAGFGEEVELLGEARWVRESSTKLSKQEFARLIDRAEQLAAELEIPLGFRAR